MREKRHRYIFSIEVLLKYFVRSNEIDREGDDHIVCKMYLGSQIITSKREI